MPSSYAHFRLGQAVRSRLTEQIKETVEAFPELFLTGLHGPDILFYYKPLSSNPVNQVGYGMHDKAGRIFFEKAAKIIKEHSENPAYLSYVYGFICHFALDVSCHGYVNDRMRESGISHTELEVEFDRMLMVKDGLDPIRQRLTGHIVPSAENAQVIQSFYDGVDVMQVQKAMEGMILYDKILLAPSWFKRIPLAVILKIVGMSGHMVSYRPNPLCEESNQKLWELYQKGEELAVTLIEEYQEYLKGNAILNEMYTYNFGSQLAES